MLFQRSCHEFEFCVGRPNFLYVDGDGGTLSAHREKLVTSARAGVTSRSDVTPCLVFRVPISREENLCLQVDPASIAGIFKPPVHPASKNAS
jgi:hypothetical protein